MQKYNVLTLIPQRPPFVMVDELDNCDNHVAQTNFTIKADNVLVTDGRFTEAGLMENMAQTAAAHAGYNALAERKPVDVGYIASVKNLVIHSLPKVGDKIITEIKITDHIINITSITGSVICNDRLVASSEMKIVIQK